MEHSIIEDALTMCKLEISVTAFSQSHDSDQTLTLIVSQVLKESWYSTQMMPAAATYYHETYPKHPLCQNLIGNVHVFTTSWSAEAKSLSSSLFMENNPSYSGLALLCFTWGLCLLWSYAIITYWDWTMWWGSKSGHDKRRKNGLSPIVINSLVCKHHFLIPLHAKTQFPMPS